MVSTTNEARLIPVRACADQPEVSEGTLMARNCALSELPGAVFAAITLVWVISCFAHLIW
ncbi:MAG: hypothetical protein ACLQAT_31300 [Candidatus Binataceae bacterium]